MKQWMATMALGVAATIASAATTPAIDADAHRAEVQAWRDGREARLKAPEGWLSLIGLHWIESGTHTVGSAPDSDIVIAPLPPSFGTVALAEGKVTFTPAANVAATIGDAPATGATTLVPDSQGDPSIVRHGTVNFIVIERSGRFALRVKDANAPTRTGYVGLDHFETDPSWRIDARFEPHAPGKTIDIASVINTIEPMANPGAVVFERDGKTYRIEAVDEGDGQLFLIFADRTNGKTTYGAGRFLYAAPPAAGSDHVVVDFNRAYNPPCVFTPYATCPLPPPENRLDLAITSGEKKYRAAAH